MRLFEWSPVWVAMDPAAVITSARAGKRRDEASAAPATDSYGQLMALLVELKEGRVLSGASVSTVDGALSALLHAIDALENLLAAAEPAKGHAAVRTSVDLRPAQSACDELVARARMAGLN